MNNFRFYTLAFLLLSSFSVFAQVENSEIPNENPNTETAYLNYDYKFQQSGFEHLAGGPINIQPGTRGLLNFIFEEDFDYIFIAVSDTLTQGVGITGKPVDFNHDLFDTDTSEVFTEYASRVLVHSIPDGMKGNVEIRPIILGNAHPKESSYYILFRKKRTY